MAHGTGSDASIEQLVQRAREGEAGALEALFEKSRSALGAWSFRRAGRSLPGGNRPSDVAQEAVLLAYRHFATFQGNTEAEWFAWLRRISRRYVAQVFRDARRKKRYETGVVPLDVPEALATPSPRKSPSQVRAHVESEREVLKHVYQLPDDQRDAIYLCYLKELKVAEVAESTGRTVRAIEGLLRRGLEALRERMIEGAEPRVEKSEGASRRLDTATDALVSYLHRRDGGQVMDPAAFVAEHPECAEELRAMLHWIERLQALRPASLARQ